MFSRADGVKFSGSFCARSGTPLRRWPAGTICSWQGVPRPGLLVGWAGAPFSARSPGQPASPAAFRQTVSSTGKIFQRNKPMSAFQEHKEELEHTAQMFGRERGRLAVSLDRITKALVLAGQHGVYCTSQRNPAVPAMDLRIIHQELVHAKEFVQSVMEELRKAKEPPKV